jgi:acetyl esterase/lipase
MKTKHFTILFTIVVIFGCLNSYAQLPPEKPLWPNGIPDNPVKYSQEKLRETEPHQGSLSHQNRVFSCVSTPTYTIFKAEHPNGVGLVICPGGGFRDVWIDREGNDFALWLAQYGVTSLVLKYRTFNEDADNFHLTRDAYNPQVYADARQAIFILRSQANELNLDVNKIGISGFSAGGALSLMAGLNLYEDELPAYANFGKISASPDFLCLIYPGISPQVMIRAKTTDSIPPVFMINGAEDNTTPAPKCVDLYQIFLDNNIPAELHIYAKGSHGFDSGIGRGNGVAMWRDSFVAWLKDMKFIEE